MTTPAARPRLLVVFYANPDDYPPTYNAVNLLTNHFEVRVVCRKTERESRLWPAGVRVDRIGWSQTQLEAKQAQAATKAWELGRFVHAVRSRLAADRPDVVLAYEPHAYAALLLAGCAAPIVYQRHEVEELDGFDTRSLGGWVGRFALRQSRRAAQLVFPEAARARYYDGFAHLEIEPLVVPNYPLLSSFVEPAFDELLPIRARDRVVFYRGSMGPGNGIVEALLAVKHFELRARLRMCGRASPEFARTMSDVITKNALSDRVELAGFVPFDELNRQALAASVGLMLYQAVDTNWTNIATANNKTYEYAACGLPAVVPDRQSFRDALGTEDWVELVDERSPPKIGAAVNRLLNEPQTYERKARAARRRFVERFNYEAVFAPMLDKMLELAHRRR
jgi:glycosyltransferase involved in cell wall biosynthesis